MAVIDLMLDALMVVKRVELEVQQGDHVGDPSLLTGALGVVRVTSLQLGVMELLEGPVPAHEFQAGYVLNGGGAVGHAGTRLRLRLENQTDGWCIVRLVASGQAAVTSP